MDMDIDMDRKTNDADEQKNNNNQKGSSSSTSNNSGNATSHGATAHGGSGTGGSGSGTGGSGNATGGSGNATGGQSTNTINPNNSSNITSPAIGDPLALPPKIAAALAQWQRRPQLSSLLGTPDANVLNNPWGAPSRRSMNSNSNGNGNGNGIGVPAGDHDEKVREPRSRSPPAKHQSFSKNKIFNQQLVDKYHKKHKGYGMGLFYDFSSFLDEKNCNINGREDGYTLWDEFSLKLALSNSEGDKRYFQDKRLLQDLRSLFYTSVENNTSFTTSLSGMGLGLGSGLRSRSRSNFKNQGSATGGGFGNFGNFGNSGHLSNFGARDNTHHNTHHNRPNRANRRGGIDFRHGANNEHRKAAKFVGNFDFDFFGVDKAADNRINNDNNNNANNGSGNGNGGKRRRSFGGIGFTGIKERFGNAGIEMRDAVYNWVPHYIKKFNIQEAREVDINGAWTYFCNYLQGKHHHLLSKDYQVLKFEFGNLFRKSIISLVEEELEDVAKQKEGKTESQTQVRTQVQTQQGQQMQQVSQMSQQQQPQAQPQQSHGAPLQGQQSQQHPQAPGQAQHHYQQHQQQQQQQLQQPQQSSLPMTFNGFAQQAPQMTAFGQGQVRAPAQLPQQYVQQQQQQQQQKGFPSSSMMNSFTHQQQNQHQYPHEQQPVGLLSSSNTFGQTPSQQRYQQQQQAQHTQHTQQSQQQGMRQQAAQHNDNEQQLQQQKQSQGGDPSKMQYYVQRLDKEKCQQIYNYQFGDFNPNSSQYVQYLYFTFEFFCL